MFEEIPDFTQQNQAGAKCTFCGQHARDMEDGRRARTFRTPTHIHMEGWIEICEKCIVEAAVKVGMVSTAEAEELEALRDAAVEHADRLLHDLDEKRSAIAGLAAELGRDEESIGSRLDAAYKRGYEEGKTETMAELASA